MYRAIVVDDHPVVRLAVGMLLQRGEIEVVGETGNGLEAVQLAKSLQPDIVILDISIPKLDGLEVIGRLRLLDVPVKVLVLHLSPPLPSPRAAVRRGRRALLPKLKNSAICLMLSRPFGPVTAIFRTIRCPLALHLILTIASRMKHRNWLRCQTAK